MKKIVFLSLLFCPFLCAAQSDVYIGIGSAGSAPAAMSLGLAGFAHDSTVKKQAEDVFSTMRFDLMFSRHFEIKETGPETNLKNLRSALEKWRKEGVENVLFGRLRKDGREAYTFEIYVYNIESCKDDCKPVLAQGYTGFEEALGAIAHKASDAVVAALTGRRGIAQTKLAYSGEVQGEGRKFKEIFIVDYDGKNQRKVTNDRSIDLLPRWSLDGTIFYTSYRYGTPDIFRINLTAGKVESVANSKGLDLIGGVSPDGRSIVLTRSGSLNTVISELNLETGESRPLTNQEGVDASPSYSPDGRFITFVSNRSGNPQVYRLDLNTKESRRLTNNFNWADTPQWSPTGEWIVFAGRRSNQHPMDIFLVDITGTRTVQLTSDAGRNEDPTWSPDGRFIAFTTTRNGKRQLYVMDADGSSPHLIADVSSGQVFTPHWSF